MSCARKLLAAALLLALTAIPGRAGEADKANMEILRDTIRANRKALVAANLTLTDDEAKKFWPIYDKYDTELTAVDDRIGKVVEDYIASFKNLSDDKATKLASDYLAAEADRVKVKQTYFDQFEKALPGKKVARMYQIQNKMDAVLRYDMASTIPVVGE